MAIYDPDAPLPERTRILIKLFEQEDKGYAFNDGGEGTMYAEEFAGLLREWLAGPGRT
jgi:hypothetical protein